MMKSAQKAAATLSIAYIRYLFETSSDANAGRDCVRAIGPGAGGVFATEIKDYQGDAAASDARGAREVVHLVRGSGGKT